MVLGVLFCLILTVGQVVVNSQMTEDRFRYG